MMDIEKGAIPSEVVEKSSTLHTASFTPHPRGSGLSGEKEIEEMFNDVVEAEQRYHEYCLANICHACEYYGDGECDNHIRAEYLYNAGYRKQSVGEWIKTETNYTCSTCNFNVISWSGEYDGYECQRGISLMKFCPNCGASMKGGADN